VSVLEGSFPLEVVCRKKSRVSQSDDGHDICGGRVGSLSYQGTIESCQLTGHARNDIASRKRRAVFQPLEFHLVRVPCRCMLLHWLDAATHGLRCSLIGGIAWVTAQDGKQVSGGGGTRR
jgi:hypothetical protein